MGNSPTQAWQPLTPRGVAAFAHAKLSRLLLVQLIIALAVTATVTWQLFTGWFPVVHDAIENLPDTGEIRSAKLTWPGTSPVMLSEDRFLALTVDLTHTGTLRSLAHVQVEFGRENVRVFSLFGYHEEPYPPGYAIAFNRSELKPWWGAWKPAFMAGAGAAAGLGVWLTWWLLATLYFIPVQLAGFVTNRDLTLLGSWKLANAALLPGAVLMIAALLLYGFNSIDLVQLLFITGAHFVVGWVYLFLSLLFVPSLSAETPKKNPFAEPPGKP